MDNHKGVGILEQKYSMRLLIHLLNGPMSKGQLASKVTVGTVSVQARIEDLKNYGLVNEVEEPVKPFKKIISLTPKGESVAKLALEIEELMEE